LNYPECKGSLSLDKVIETIAIEVFDLEPPLPAMPPDDYYQESPLVSKDTKHHPNDPNYCYGSYYPIQ
jgi:hypothetical protein